MSSCVFLCVIIYQAVTVDGPIVVTSEFTKSISLWKEYMSLDTAKNAIKVVGAPVDRV
jgi:hypothetical protein